MEVGGVSSLGSDGMSGLRPSPLRDVQQFTEELGRAAARLRSTKPRPPLTCPHPERGVKFQLFRTSDEAETSPAARSVTACFSLLVENDVCALYIQFLPVPRGKTSGAGVQSVDLGAVGVSLMLSASEQDGQ
ncbi:unnamed protein product [Pleuronectes platessa]|uniref:Uncharacterized protein n=1 Tax=Pleuronectes platessa TaxID=8262 RepID=A0A9N7UQ85_PLEPL|nr:unnamed protein product [Pleuronectes platessa]